MRTAIKAIEKGFSYLVITNATVTSTTLLVCVSLLSTQGLLDLLLQLWTYVRKHLPCTTNVSVCSLLGSGMHRTHTAAWWVAN